jgi:hypothetical protein
MAGRREAARDFAALHRSALQSGDEARAVWAFMREAFGTDGEAGS